MVTQKEILNGIDSGTPDRVLLREISKGVEEARKRGQVDPIKSDETWRELAMAVAKRKRNAEIDRG